MNFPLLLAACSAIVTASGYLSSLAALDTSQVLAGELWRLLTGHLAHLTWRQYAADAPVFTVLYTVYRRQVGAVSALMLGLCAAVTVSLCVVFAGMHQVYGGLSGLSCAALAALLCGMIKEQPGRAFPYLMSALFCCYLLFMGGLAGGVRVAQEAHFAGALSGVIFAALQSYPNRFKAPRKLPV
jgi:membrane associated rhomboid family serine protease